MSEENGGVRPEPEEVPEEAEEAAAVQEHPEKLQRIRVVGDGREDAAVDRLRDLGLTLLVVRHRHGERFLERRRMDCVAVLGSALLLDRHLCHRPHPSASPTPSPSGRGGALGPPTGFRLCSSSSSSSRS